MKKLIVIGIAMMMVIGLAGAANAAGYLFNLLVQNPQNSAQKGQVQFATNANAITSWLSNLPYVAPQITAFEDNNPASPNRLVQLKITTEPDAWYSQVFAMNGYVGVYDVRVTSSTGDIVLAPGAWFMYKGIGTVVDGYMTGPVTLMAIGTMKTTESTWETSTFGATFEANDFITMYRRLEIVPEPGTIGTILAALSILGPAGIIFRRRKA